MVDVAVDGPHAGPDQAFVEQAVSAGVHDDIATLERAPHHEQLPRICNVIAVIVTFHAVANLVLIQYNAAEAQGHRAVHIGNGLDKGMCQVRVLGHSTGNGCTLELRLTHAEMN